MKLLILDLGLTCAQCAAKGVKVELQVPDELPTGQVRIGTEIVCPTCGHNGIFGALPATVTKV